MTDETTADQLVDGILRALAEREIDAVPGLLRLLIVVDPRRAMQVLDTIEIGLQIAKEQ